LTYDSFPDRKSGHAYVISYVNPDMLAMVKVIRRRVSGIGIPSIPSSVLLRMKYFLLVHRPLSKSKMNFTTSGINGTIKEWNGTKGTLQSDTASGQDKTFWFDKSNIVVPRYSAAYEPKVGDWVTSTALPDDNTRVDRVLQSIRMLSLTQGRVIILSNGIQVKA
jgi:hypothetical protein